MRKFKIKYRTGMELEDPWYYFFKIKLKGGRTKRIVIRDLPSHERRKFKKMRRFVRSHYPT